MSITGGGIDGPGSALGQRAGMLVVKLFVACGERRICGFNLGARGKRLKATISPDQQVKADHPGHVWALDFQFDSD